MNKWDSVRAIAVATTPKGVLVATEDGMQATAYGNFTKGDVLLVSLVRRLTDNLCLAEVESVIAYAQRDETV